jgi:hypothetical protein
MSRWKEVRLWDFWEFVKDRLDSSTMQAALGGAGRVRLAWENYPVSEGAENQPWGRVVIVPATPIWDVIDRPGETKKEQFLVRVEFNNFGALGYNVAISIEAAHAEAYYLLDGWTPTGVRHMQVAFPVYRYTLPQRSPLWNAEQNLYYASAEYRFESFPKAGVASVVITPDPVLLTF